MKVTISKFSSSSGMKFFNIWFFSMKLIKYKLGNKENDTVLMCIGNNSKFTYAIRVEKISLEIKPRVTGCDCSCDGKTFSKHFWIHQLSLCQTYPYHLSPCFMERVQYDKDICVDTTMFNMTHIFHWWYVLLMLLQFALVLKGFGPLTWQVCFSFLGTLLLPHLLFCSTGHKICVVTL